MRHSTQKPYALPPWHAVPESIMGSGTATMLLADTYIVAFAFDFETCMTMHELVDP